MADFLFWKDEWNTDIPDVDEMHRAMAVKLNHAFETYRDCGEEHVCTHAVSGVLNEFLELTREHFGAEEEKMRRYNYPDYSDHKKEHIILVAELAQYIRDLEQERVEFDASSRRDLKNWFIGHVVIADRAFARYYHGLANE